jgi:hypothetical protein
LRNFERRGYGPIRTVAPEEDEVKKKEAAFM